VSSVTRGKKEMRSIAVRAEGKRKQITPAKKGKGDTGWPEKRPWRRGVITGSSTRELGKRKRGVLVDRPKKRGVLLSRGGEGIVPSEQGEKSSLLLY